MDTPHPQTLVLQDVLQDVLGPSFLDFLKYFFKHFRVHLFKFIILLGLKPCRLVRKGHAACHLASFCKFVYEPESSRSNLNAGG